MRFWRDPDNRSVLVGIAAVLLVHLFLFAFAPYLLRTDEVHASAKDKLAARQFNIEIAPDAFIPLPKPPPPKN